MCSVHEPIPHHRFGQTTIAKVSNSDELRQMLVDPWFEFETIVIKPNWVSKEPADFTDSKTLRTMLEALDSHIVVTESHQIHRLLNPLEEGMSFTVGDKKVNWNWLLKGDGWSGRIADPTEVKRSVETRFRPVQVEKLYSMVPKRLYDLRGSTFISFARLKMYASFTMKNLFGMIPDPLRPWWHGPKNSRIATSIVDVNKVYHSFFNVYGICEALYTTAVPHTEGKFEGIYSARAL